MEWVLSDEEEGESWTRKVEEGRERRSKERRICA